jgi:imidazole glycerol-phosphate synthase subunit HisH
VSALRDVAIVDYSMGNIRSVENGFRAAGADVAVVSDPAQLGRARGIVVPGVGAFGDGMRNLDRGGWLEPLEEEIRHKGKPFLGLCVGMQLLAEAGTEHGSHTGFGWVSGVVERLPANGVRIPHIGWNDVAISPGSVLFSGLGESATFYFVHSYALRPSDAAVVSARCSHGTEFAAALEIENIFATQFHPEKSQRAGLKVLSNFAELCSRSG